MISAIQFLVIVAVVTVCTTLALGDDEPSDQSVGGGIDSADGKSSWPHWRGLNFGVRRLVAALAFQHRIFVNRRGKVARISFQFQVKSAEQTNVIPEAQLPSAGFARNAK